MLPIAVSDIHEVSRAWKYLIDNQSKDYHVVAYVTTRYNPPKAMDGIPVLDMEQFSMLYKSNTITKFLLPRERFFDQSTIISDLKKLGVDRSDVLMPNRLNKPDVQSIKEYDDVGYLPYLEFQVVDHCNLNCIGCQHYSALVKRKVVHDAGSLRSDLQKLHTYIEDIGKIRIMGGEPLLHPYITDIITATRDIYNFSDIHIVTNGLCLYKMDEAFFETCKKKHVHFYISHYPPLIGKEKELTNFLEEKGVEFTLTALMSQFLINQSLTPCDDAERIYDNCPRACCINLYQGKIATCFLPFVTKYFNEYFKTELPSDGAVDLYDETLTTRKLKSLIQRPLDRCRFCREDSLSLFAAWNKIQGESGLQDWIYDCALERNLSESAGRS